MRRRVRERALGHEQRLAQQGLLLLVATLSGSQMQAERSSILFSDARHMFVPLAPSHLWTGSPFTFSCNPFVCNTHN